MTPRTGRLAIGFHLQQLNPNRTGVGECKPLRSDAAPNYPEIGRF